MNCVAVWVNPHNAVAMEYISTLMVSARTRPKRSANQPKPTPPMAAETSVIDIIAPLIAADRCISRCTCPSTSAYNITSMLSSIHPSDAASNVCLSSREDSASQP
jgi:hypothetical protein